MNRPMTQDGSITHAEMRFTRETIRIADGRRINVVEVAFNIAAGSYFDASTELDPGRDTYGLIPSFGATAAKYYYQGITMIHEVGHVFGEVSVGGQSGQSYLGRSEILYDGGNPGLSVANQREVHDACGLEFLRSTGLVSPR